MTEPSFTDRPIPWWVIGAIAGGVGLAVALAGLGQATIGGGAGRAVLAALVAAAPALWLRARNTVRVETTGVVVGGALRRFEVQFSEVVGWRVLGRAEAFEVRAALGGTARVAFLPWLPAAACLQLESGRICLVGTRRPRALRDKLARAAPYREWAGGGGWLLDVLGEPARAGGHDLERVWPDALTGWAAALLLVTSAGFGVLVTLIVIDAATHLPGGLAVVGSIAGPVLGALVVAEAASRTPVVPVGVAALAAVCAGMAPPVAAALGGASFVTAGLLGLLTVPVAFAAATLHGGAAAPRH